MPKPSSFVTKGRRFFLELDIDTPKEARQFMDAIAATETSYEDWEDCHGTEYTCSFGYTHYRPQQINCLADTMGIAVIYVAADVPNLITL